MTLSSCSAGMRTTRWTSSPRSLPRSRSSGTRNGTRQWSARCTSLSWRTTSRPPAQQADSESKRGGEASNGALQRALAHGTRATSRSAARTGLRARSQQGTSRARRLLGWGVPMACQRCISGAQGFAPAEPHVALGKMAEDWLFVPTGGAVDGCFSTFPYFRI